MWDLEQIIENNNAAALDAMMQGQQMEETQAPLPEVWPLSLLAQKLMRGPPLISEILNCLDNIEVYARFAELIDVLMPEHKKEIMAEPRHRRVYRFSYLFGQKYYPLPVNTECGIGDLVEGMPVELLAMSYSQYHNLEMRPGYLLLLSLVVYPYEGDERDEEDDSVPFDPRYLPKDKDYKPSASDINWLQELVSSLNIGGRWTAPMGFTMVKTDANRIELREAKDTPEVKETIRRTLLIAEKIGIEAKFPKNGRTADEKINGARLPLLDMVQGMVGADLAGRIPGSGWTPEELHKMTDNTPYDGVGSFADWVCSQTGCVMLDANYENCEYIEGYGEPVFKWTRNNVILLTEQWPKVKQIRGKIDHIVEWLEQDQINHFNELLGFLLKASPDLTGSHPAHIYDPMEHACVLDQSTGEEDDDSDEDC